MNDLTIKFSTTEHNQKELNRKINQLEAELKLFLYTLELMNRKGVTIQ